MPCEGSARVALMHPAAIDPHFVHDERAVAHDDAAAGLVRGDLEEHSLAGPEPPRAHVDEDRRALARHQAAAKGEEQGAQPDAASQRHASPIGRPAARLKTRARPTGAGLERLALLAVLALAFALRAGSALALPNIYWPDEIFQTLEPAHRLLFGSGVVTWEWRTGARNWLFPGFLAGVMQLSAPFGPGSTGYVAGTTLVLSAVGVLPAWAAWRVARRRAGAGPALLAAFACAVWCELVYFAPKALNEIAAGHLLVAAVALAPQPGEAASPRRGFIAGLVFGLAVALRPHLGPAVLAGIVFASRAQPQPRRGAAPLWLGAGAAFALGGIVDAFTWGVPFHSYVRNPFENLVLARSLVYGTGPFYAYLRSFLRVWTFSFGAILALFIWGARRHPLPALLAGVALLVHSAIPHKEYRFVYPVIVLVVWVAAVASAELAEDLRRRFPGWRTRVLPIAALLWLLASLAAVPHLSTQHVPRGDAGRQDTLYWRRYEGSKRSFTALSLRDDVCGVALLDLGWAYSGGYTYLHHDVPLFQLRDRADVSAVEPFANYLVSRRIDAPRLSGYTRERCWSWICLYRRPGPCEPKPGYDLNAWLAERGE